LTSKNPRPKNPPSILKKTSQAKKSSIFTGDLELKAWKRKIDQVFMKMDQDRSGFVTRAEITAMYAEAGSFIGEGEKELLCAVCIN
jgi:Ca2+-binding EF-hand superfamily protein